MIPTFRELVESFAKQGETVALIGPRCGENEREEVWSYAELARRVQSTARTIPANSAPGGPPVALVLPNSLCFVRLFLALAYQGHVVAPLNPASPPEALRHELLAIQPRAVLGSTVEGLGIPVWEDVGPTPFDPILHIDPETPVLQLQTSGTTSKPKSVLLSHRQLLTSAANIAATYRLQPDDRSMLVMPLFHVHGLMAGLLAALVSGGAVIVPGSFSASAFWPDALIHGATWSTAVPTILQILLLSGQNHDQGHGVLRFLRSCSSSLSPILKTRLEERFGCPVVEAYGMTEATHQMASNPLPPAQRKPASVGLPTGVNVSIRSEDGQALAPGRVGEVCVCGPTVISRYLTYPAEIFS